MTMQAKEQTTDTMQGHCRVAQQFQIVLLSAAVIASRAGTDGLRNLHFATDYRDWLCTQRSGRPEACKGSVCPAQQH